MPGIPSHRAREPLPRDAGATPPAPSAKVLPSDPEPAPPAPATKPPARRAGQGGER